MSNTLPSFVAEALEKADRKQIQLAGVGCFSQVIKVADSGFVIKQSFDHPVVGNLQPTEKRIYERLGHHPFILRYYGEYCQGTGLPNGLVFQYHRAGTLADNLALANYPEKRTLWPLQAAEALRFIHSKNVIHSDLGSHNFLIQEDGTLALADFGGSRIDDTAAVVSYSTRYARPCSDSDDSDSTAVDDLFALGTVIYEISVGHQLYAGRSSREIRKLLHQREFPELGSIAADVRAVIGKCWSNGYQAAEEVCGMPMAVLEREYLGDIVRKCWEYGYAGAEDLKKDLDSALTDQGWEVDGDEIHGFRGPGLFEDD